MKNFYPHVVDEYGTLKKILEHRLSIARYGDGEIKLCFGRSAISQPAGAAIGRRLREILIDDNPSLLIGIPRVVRREEDWPRREKALFWNRYAVPKITKLYSRHKQYYSSFITRPDSGTGLYSRRYWDLMRGVWHDRPVTIIKGKGTGINKNPHLFSGAAGGAPRVVLGPKYDAFAVYDRLLERAMAEEPERLLVLSLGPTATVLAADLAARGRQALDLGHLGMFYAKIHPKFDPELATAGGGIS